MAPVKVLIVPNTSNVALIPKRLVIFKPKKG